MTAHRYLYILVESGGQACKIGISIDPWKRSEALHESFDYASSLMISMPFRSALVVEKFIHKVLGELSVPRDKKDGYTEWFTIDAKDKAVQVVDSFGAALSVGEWEPVTKEKLQRTKVDIQAGAHKKHAVTIRLTPDQEDRVRIHAARHKIKKLTPMTQVIFEEGLALMDGMLKKEEELRAGQAG